MHATCIKWLEEIKVKYPNSFKNSKILELGSLDQGLFVRKLFTDCQYVGIDAVEGYTHSIDADKSLGVDMRMKAKDTSFDKDYFDVLVCVSMFEHDPTWKESISHNLPFVKKGGLVLFEWGAEGNLNHGLNHAPVTTQEFNEFIRSQPIVVNDQFFESDKYNSTDCPGAYAVEAMKT